MAAPRTIFTIGHSDLSLDAFLDRLASAGVTLVADVRRYPGSKRFPHFAKAAFEPALRGRGVGYVHLPALGGFRAAPDDTKPFADLDPKWHPYAANMQTTAFANAVDDLIARADDETVVGVMCAERDPQHCHRHLLADALVVRGVEVVHLLADGEQQPHRLHPAALIDGTAVTYPSRTPSLFD